MQIVPIVLFALVVVVLVVLVVPIVVVVFVLHVVLSCISFRPDGFCRTYFGFVVPINETETPCTFSLIQVQKNKKRKHQIKMRSPRGGEIELTQSKPQTKIPEQNIARQTWLQPLLLQQRGARQTRPQATLKQHRHL